MIRRWFENHPDPYGRLLEVTGWIALIALALSVVTGCADLGQAAHDNMQRWQYTGTARGAPGECSIAYVEDRGRVRYPGGEWVMCVELEPGERVDAAKDAWDPREGTIQIESVACARLDGACDAYQ